MGRGISRGGCRLNKSFSSLSAGEWGYVPALLAVLFEASQQQSLQAAVVIAELLSHVQLLVTPWTAAHRAPPSLGFSRQEYWSGVPLPSLTYHLADTKSKETMIHKPAELSLQTRISIYPGTSWPLHDRMGVYCW